MPRNIRYTYIVLIDGNEVGETTNSVDAKRMVLGYKRMTAHYKPRNITIVKRSNKGKGDENIRSS